jgi:hypothetical protein
VCSCVQLPLFKISDGSINEIGFINVEQVLLAISI